jgi:hypothetical protein
LTAQATVPIGIMRDGAAQSRATSIATTIPWFVWSGLVAVSSIAFGLYWDISWHMTIGRDTFWTPAHLAIHFGGILAAFTCTYLIFSTTFGHDNASRDASVSVWGFRGPVGAFLTAWGGVTMLASAPFDNWWHNSFGLDVEILSPPHVVLGLGILAVQIGVLVLIVAEKNRATGGLKPKLTWLFLYLSGLGLFLHSMLKSEFSDANLMHSAIFYRAIAIGTPTVLIAYARGSGHKWGATIIASVYTVVMLTFLWTFPLFPAHPKLGPVYTNVTHMVPMGFPLLLIVPAFAVDLVLNRFSNRGAWFQAFAAGTAFLAVLIAVQWPAGSFLISPLARNGIFGMTNFPYQEPISMHQLAYQFRLDSSRSVLYMGMGVAWIATFLSTRVGLAFGNWLLRIRR